MSDVLLTKWYCLNSILGMFPVVLVNLDMKISSEVFRIIFTSSSVFVLVSLSVIMSFAYLFACLLMLSIYFLGDAWMIIGFKMIFIHHFCIYIVFHWKESPTYCFFCIIYIPSNIYMTYPLKQLTL